MQEISRSKICIQDNLQNNFEYNEEENRPYTNISSSLNSNLIVNYLPHDIDDLALKGLFIEFGEILMTKVVRDKNTNKSLGYGFVKFLKDDDASKAIQKLNGFVIDNKYLKVTIARPPSLEIRNCKLYVTNLPLHYSENNVIELFQDFGEIIECRVIKDKTLRVNKGVAFVQFNLNSQANAALSLNGYKLEDSSRGLVIKYAEDQHKKKELTRLQQGLTYNSPYSRSTNAVDVDTNIEQSLMKNDHNIQPTTFYYYPNQLHNPSITHHVSNSQNTYNNNNISNMYSNQSHSMLLPIGMQASHMMNIPMAQHYSTYTNHHPINNTIMSHSPQAVHMSQPMLSISSPNYNSNNIKGEFVSTNIPNQSLYTINNNWYNSNMSYSQHIGETSTSNQFVHNEVNNKNKNTIKYPSQQAVHHNNSKKGLITTSSVSKKQQYYNLSSTYNTSTHSKNGYPNHSNEYFNHNDINNKNTSPSLILLVSNLPLNFDVHPILYKLFSAYGKIISFTNTTSDEAIENVKYSIEIIPYNIHALQLAVHDLSGSYCLCEGSSPIQVDIYT